MWIKVTNLGSKWLQLCTNTISLSFWANYETSKYHKLSLYFVCRINGYPCFVLKTLHEFPRLEIFVTRIDFKKFEANRSNLQLNFEIALLNRIDLTAFFFESNQLFDFIKYEILNWMDLFCIWYKYNSTKQKSCSTFLAS